MAQTIMFEGIVLSGVHDWKTCQAHGTRPCTIHNPVYRHMAHMYLHWRQDRGIFERICPHGVGHPDPNQYAYWREVGKEYEGVHGCCHERCCQPPVPGGRNVQ